MNRSLGSFDEFVNESMGIENKNVSEIISNDNEIDDDESKEVSNKIINHHRVINRELKSLINTKLYLNKKEENTFGDTEKVYFDEFNSLCEPTKKSIGKSIKNSLVEISSDNRNSFLASKKTNGTLCHVRNTPNKKKKCSLDIVKKVTPISKVINIIEFIFR